MQTPLGAEQLRHEVAHTQPLPVPMHEVQQIHWNNIEGKIMNLIRFIKSLLAPPSPESIALRELEESRRELLSAQTSQEYAAKMAEFHKGKIKRLTAFLKETMEEEQS
jgi:hypothetical protein